ncbi:MAG: ParA family protein [Gemmataceae bacterium]
MTPFKVAIASHKGGTGRTTTALALVWHLGQQGHRVILVDTDPTRAALRVAMVPEEGCRWEGVTTFGGIPDWDDLQGDIVIVDGPRLQESTRHRILPHVDAVILTSLAESLSLRTIPAATKALREVDQTKRPQFLGILLTGVDEKDPLQRWLLQEFRQSHSDILLEPPISYEQEVSDWPLTSGTPLPPGRASESYARLASMLSRVSSETSTKAAIGEELSW